LKSILLTERAQALGKERASLEAVVETIDQLEQGVEDVEGLLELAVEEEDQELSLKISWLSLSSVVCSLVTMMLLIATLIYSQVLVVQKRKTGRQ